MAVESAADRAVFLGADEFGNAATFTPAGGAAVSLAVLFDRPHELAELGEVGMLATAYRAMLRDDDLAAEPVAGDQLVIGAQTFLVGRAGQDISGAFWTLDLDLQG